MRDRPVKPPPPAQHRPRDVGTGTGVQLSIGARPCPCAPGRVARQGAAPQLSLIPIHSNLASRDVHDPSGRPRPPAGLCRPRPLGGPQAADFRHFAPVSPAGPGRGKSTEPPLISVAKAEPGMYEASAPHGQAPSPPFLRFGGSIVVQGSGHEIAIRGAALTLGRAEELRVPAEPSRLAAAMAPRDCIAIRARTGWARRTVPNIRRANRANRPHPINIGRRDGYLFSRFFPSIPCHGLYKIGPGASARTSTGDVASRSSQPHCGYLLSLEADA